MDRLPGESEVGYLGRLVKVPTIGFSDKGVKLPPVALTDKVKMG
jgi:hypothetical protein